MTHSAEPTTYLVLQIYEQRVAQGLNNRLIQAITVQDTRFEFVFGLARWSGHWRGVVTRVQSDGPCSFQIPSPGPRLDLGSHIEEHSSISLIQERNSQQYESQHNE